MHKEAQCQNMQVDIICQKISNFCLQCSDKHLDAEVKDIDLLACLPHFTVNIQMFQSFCVTDFSVIVELHYLGSMEFLFLFFSILLYSVLFCSIL